VIETYTFWNVHEPERGEYDFGGNLNVIQFLREVKEAGLYAVVRFGYVYVLYMYVYIYIHIMYYISYTY
jgi:beta-galactosidase GanA